jgi:hypothetical protein
MASAQVPCNDGEPNAIVSVTTTALQPKQNPNKCHVDNAQQSSQVNSLLQSATESAEAQVIAGSPDPTHVSAEPIGTGLTLFSAQANLACLTFDDAGKWRGGGENWWYAGWGIQAFNDDAQGIYKENASFELQKFAGSGLSLKVNHGKPFRSQIVSPQFEVQAGDRVVTRVSYSISDFTPNHSAWAEISVHVAGDTNAPVVKGFFVAPDTWKKLESVFTPPSAAKIQVTLQANNLYNDTGLAIYFDNIEIWVNDQQATLCEYEVDGLKFAG